MRIAPELILKVVVLTAVMTSVPAYSFADVVASAALTSRKIIVFGRDTNDIQLKRQIGMLERVKDLMSGRDVILQKVIGTDAQSVVLRRKFRVSHDFHVLLVGRDGHIAASADYPLVPRLLFQVIDSMPMRQEEMRIAHLNQAPLR